jgi:hypothetical protein
MVEEKEEICAIGGLMVTKVFDDGGTMEFNHMVIRDSDNGNGGWNGGIVLCVVWK